MPGEISAKIRYQVRTRSGRGSGDSGGGGDIATPAAERDVSSRRHARQFVTFVWNIGITVLSSCMFCRKFLLEEYIPAAAVVAATADAVIMVRFWPLSEILATSGTPIKLMHLAADLLGVPLEYNKMTFIIRFHHSSIMRRTCSGSGGGDSRCGDNGAVLS